MAYDLKLFSGVSVADTCSIWHILSSMRLYEAAAQANRHFITTPMVMYECLQKPRQSANCTENAHILNTRLNNAQKKGRFTVQECSLEDLNMMAQAPKSLGSGEISCIALAYRIQSVAFITDDLAARRFAEKKLPLEVGTTPRLYGYLQYHRYLSYSDHQAVIEEHEKFEKRPLTKFFKEVLDHAMRAQLMGRDDTP